MKSTTAKTMLLAVLVSSTIGCIPAKDKTIALGAIEQHHARFNDSKFEEIYDESTAEHKNAISKEDFVENMSRLRQGEGRVLSSEELAVDYRSDSGDVRIKLLMLVTFERRQPKEEFIYRVSEGKALLERYRFIDN
jgi:hypothetical protein